MLININYLHVLSINSVEQPTVLWYDITQTLTTKTVSAILDISFQNKASDLSDQFQSNSFYIRGYHFKIKEKLKDATHDFGEEQWQKKCAACVAVISFTWARGMYEKLGSVKEQKKLRGGRGRQAEGNACHCAHTRLEIYFKCWFQVYSTVARFLWNVMSSFRNARNALITNHNFSALEAQQK